MRVAIVGGGATGLAAGYDLAGSGHHVTIYEAAPRVGGLASGFREEGWQWSLERFYHHWFATDHDIFHLVRQLGLQDQLFFRRPLTAVWHAEKLYQFDSPGSLLRFPGLTLLEKLRLGLVTLYLRVKRDWRRLEGVTIHDWLPRAVGQRAYRTVWEPLLVGKFGDRHYRQVNMAWFWARIHARTATLGTFFGGFQAFMEALADRIRDRGGAILLGTPVSSIAPDSRGGLQITSSSGSAAADCCLVTLSPRLLTRLVPALPADYTARLAPLDSLGAVVLILALDRPLCGDIYWASLPKSEFPFLVVVEHTNFVPAGYFGGSHIVYCGDYCPAEHPYFRMPAEEVCARFTGALRKLNPAFDPRWVQRWWLSRETYAQPVPTVHYSQQLPELRTPVAGLYFASMSHVYPWDRGTNYAVRLGRAAARTIEREMRSGEKGLADP